MIDDTRSRWGTELSFKRWNFLLQGEYISGLDKGSSLVGGGCGSTPTIVKGNFNKDGYWAALMYTYKEKFAPIVKYQYYNVHSDNASINDQTFTEIIFGFNYYFNDWTRLQLNYVMTTDSYISSDKEYMKNYLVVQAQIKFN